MLAYSTLFSMIAVCGRSLPQDVVREGEGEIVYLSKCMRIKPEGFESRQNFSIFRLGMPDHRYYD